jgi:hypothetical protein
MFTEEGFIRNTVPCPRCGARRYQACDTPLCHRERRNAYRRMRYRPGVRQPRVEEPGVVKPKDGQ